MNIQPYKKGTLTVDLSSDYIQEMPWDADPQALGGRHSGSFQFVWSGTGLVGASWKWQISNDGVNWDDWTGSLCVDNSIIVTYEPTLDDGVLSYEVIHWPYKYYRINYTKGPATTGTLSITIHRNK